MNNNITIKVLSPSVLHPRMLDHFSHKQFISQKWVKTAGGWELTPVSILREWSDEKRAWIPDYLCRQTERGGYALGAFSDDKLVGFAGVDGVLRGESAKYANLTMLFVDDDWKRQGVGSALFRQICGCAATIHAEKLFISAIPSRETVAFYFRMGCSDTNEIVADFVDTEDDRYLEYIIKIEKTS